MTGNSSALRPEQVGRFAKAFFDFINEVRLAAKDAVLNSALATQPALLAWQTEALPVLERQNLAIQDAVKLYQGGETQPIVRLADSACGLSKQLDGYPLDFAGPEHAEALGTLKTAVVVAAYQLYAASREPH